MKYIDLKLMKIVEDPDTDGFKIVNPKNGFSDLYFDLNLYGYHKFKEDPECYYQCYFKQGNFTNYISSHLDSKLINRNWVYFPARFVKIPKKHYRFFPDTLNGFDDICEAIISAYKHYDDKAKAAAKKQRDKRGSKRQKRLDRIESIKAKGIDLSMVLDRIKNEEMDVLLTQIETVLEKKK